MRPVISVAIRPWTNDEREKLRQVLTDLIGNDPTMRVDTALASGQIIISGTEELHLQQICDRIPPEFRELNAEEPKVIYLETIRKHAEAEGKYIRQTGGSGNYGHVKIRLEPAEEGSGVEFVSAIKGGVVPEKYVKPAEDGIREALNGGALAGYKLVDVKATLFDGSYHDIDSNEMAFKIAASMAAKEAARKAHPVVLEPMMAVEVVTPQEYMGTAIGDLNSRRGRIESIEYRGVLPIIRAIVPLAEMLRSSAHGRPTYPMRFARYEKTSLRGGSGGSEAGVTANKPKGPGERSGSAAARPDPDCE
jgi:elongation factor G